MTARFRTWRRPAPLWTALALLTGTAVASLWFTPPPSSEQWVIWAVMVGGCLAASCAVVMARLPDAAAPWLLAVSAVMLLSTPLVLATGARSLAVVLAVLASTVVVPLAALRVVERRPAIRLLRWADGCVIVSGAGLAAASVRGGPAALVATEIASATAICAGTWTLFEVTSGDDRRRVLWLVLGSAATALLAMLLFAAENSLPMSPVYGVVAAGTLSLPLPLAITMALVAPLRTDVRAVIRGATVLIVMLALSAAVYEGIAAVWELAVGARPGKGVPALLAAVIASGYQRVRQWVEASMDEMLFGRSADPVETLTRLGTDLTAGAPPPLWLHTLRSTLGVPGIALRQDGATIATAGTVDDGHTTLTALHAGGEHMGDLAVCLPPGHLRLPRAAAAVVELVAAPLAQALHAARLSEQLRVSRGRVVTALEEERRRMRRDLHDGLGPTLTGIAYNADAAVNLIATDPDRAAETLRGLRADVGDAITEIRRIVYGLRPRALDEFGLVDAVRQRVTPLRAADGRPLDLTIDAPNRLPQLPAAVEVAAYRVAVEAVTNIARHSDGARARLTLALHDATSLRVTVADTGRCTEPWTPGVGIQSMHERVEQIGGTLTILTTPQGATVTADLPLVIPA
ncbi:sensor histidine kinase [Streptomyces sp. 142MFCol3.1]|uniref:sensor histidine kinase n=1 Tax=Streptomyces sp. 142MFCol3.1 TaxID=1172179 RepID=UPI000428E706|nr:histidine kinase [Streptomyces sp. 142MFCol3.1]